MEEPRQLRGPETNALSDSAECLPETIIHVFFVRFQVSSDAVRRASLILHYLFVSPFINIFILNYVVVAVINVINQLIPIPFTFGRLFRITCIVQYCTNVLLVVNTELSVAANSHLIAASELRWGLSQTLAIFLILIPALEAISIVSLEFTRRYNSRWSQFQYQFQRLLQISEESWTD